MFSSRYFINPKRKKELSSLSILGRIRMIFQRPIISLGLWLGFQHIDYSYVHGDKSRIQIGHSWATMAVIKLINWESNEWEH